MARLERAPGPGAIRGVVRPDPRQHVPRSAPSAKAGPADRGSGAARPDTAVAGPAERVGEGERVLDALSGLTPDERIVLVLRYEADLTIPAIAALVDIPGRHGEVPPASRAPQGSSGPGRWRTMTIETDFEGRLRAGLVELRPEGGAPLGLRSRVVEIPNLVRAEAPWRRLARDPERAGRRHRHRRSRPGDCRIWMTRVPIIGLPLAGAPDGGPVLGFDPSIEGMGLITGILPSAVLVGGLMTCERCSRGKNPLQRPRGHHARPNDHAPRHRRDRPWNLGSRALTRPLDRERRRCSARVRAPTRGTIR